VHEQVAIEDKLRELGARLDEHEEPIEQDDGDEDGLEGVSAMNHDLCFWRCNANHDAASVSQPE
jgi:hypothetical protein